MFLEFFEALVDCAIQTTPLRLKSEKGSSTTAVSSAVYVKDGAQKLTEQEDESRDEDVRDEDNDEDEEEEEEEEKAIQPPDNTSIAPVMSTASLGLVNKEQSLSAKASVASLDHVNNKSSITHEKQEGVKSSASASRHSMGKVCLHRIILIFWIFMFVIFKNF